MSSTKVDLEEYRAAIAAHLPRLDVLFRGMEIFGARPAEPRQTMLGEVAICDLFVGILGHRYGSEHESGLSYTELEYRKAREIGLPVFMFLADDTLGSNPKLRESDEKLRKLEAFKDAVEHQTTTERFGNPQDLALKVSNAIQHWLDETRWARGEMLVAATLPNESMRRNIRLLYSVDEREVVLACEALVRSRQAFEHFYALLRFRKDSDAIRDAVFRILPWIPAECRRVEQVLEELVQDKDARLRRGAAKAICNRNRPENQNNEQIVVPISLASAVLEGVRDVDEGVRFEIAHALPKIANKVPERKQECRDRLNHLAASDPSPRVREQAAQSLLDIG